MKCLELRSLARGRASPMVSSTVRDAAVDHPRRSGRPSGTRPHRIRDGTNYVRDAWALRPGHEVVRQAGHSLGALNPSGGDRIGGCTIADSNLTRPCVRRGSVRRLRTRSCEHPASSDSDHQRGVHLQVQDGGLCRTPPSSSPAAVQSCESHIVQFTRSDLFVTIYPILERAFLP